MSRSHRGGDRVEWGDLADPGPNLSVRIILTTGPAEDPFATIEAQHAERIGSLPSSSWQEVQVNLRDHLALD
jgi:hypothetical protein